MKIGHIGQLSCPLDTPGSIGGQDQPLIGLVFRRPGYDMDRREMPAGETEQIMLVFGLILLLLGIFLHVSILYTIGIILLIVGAVLWILGAVGRPVGGRKVWF
ncbi:hypothetical protein [Actinoplanes sp. HUAS TT8]|uniref:hypothetical protein n=1 Tax=Actinoplanes sp. HUAS TT8 TaxID=3447453 RepID=UPI003F51FCBB